MALVVRRFEIYLIGLDPTTGSEMKKTRPCLIISPDEMNASINTVIIAPMTTAGKAYPTRVACKFQNKVGQIVLDQVRAVDKTRLLSRLGKIDRETRANVLKCLAEMFAP